MDMNMNMMKMGMMCMCAVILISHTQATNVVACGTLSIDGESYVLTGNLNATGQNCLTIGAHNITLNGMGYTIGYSKTTLGHAVTNTGGYDNLIITNFSTIELNNTLIDHSSNGAPLYFSNMNNSTVSYINMISALGGGIYGVTTKYNTFTHNNITSSSVLANGVHMTTTSEYNNISYNNISMSDGGAGGMGVYLNSGYNNVIYNNINTTKGSGFLTGVNTSSNNTFSYNIVNSTNHHAFAALGMNYSIVDANTFISNLDVPVEITYTSVGNTYSNNVISSPWGSTGGSKRIMLLGDSITNYNRSGVLGYGYYLNNLLSNGSVGWVVSTRGVSGDTTQEMIDRYNIEMTLYNPRVITIMAGMNDIIQSVPEQTTINNILYLANTSQASGRHVYILTVTNSSAYNTTSLDINLTTQANALGYTVINMFDVIDSIPNNGEYNTFNTSYYVDSTHPNTFGYSLLGNRLYQQIYADYILVPPPAPLVVSSPIFSTLMAVVILIICTGGFLYRRDGKNLVQLSVEVILVAILLYVLISTLWS